MASWAEYFMDMATHVASRSKDPATKVGCVVISADRAILATGYNGIPRRVKDLEVRMQRPDKYLWTAHAEENAIASSARIGARLDGATIYVTHPPCARCARGLIQAGVVKVVVGDGKTNMPEEEFLVADQMFAEAEVVVVKKLQSIA